MTHATFTEQVARLQRTWPSAYPEERLTSLYGRIKHMPDHWMEATVTELIDTERRAPLLPEFLQKIFDYNQRVKEEKDREYVRGPSGFAGVLEQAAKNQDVKLANMEIVKARVRLIQKNGEMPMSEFLECCDMLDKAAGLKR